MITKLGVVKDWLLFSNLNSPSQLNSLPLFSPTTIRKFLTTKATLDRWDFSKEEKSFFFFSKDLKFEAIVNKKRRCHSVGFLKCSFYVKKLFCSNSLSKRIFCRDAPP